MSRGEQNPQKIFSTVGLYKENLNFVLTSNYLCNTPYGTFDCSILRDEKKHSFFIRKNLSNFEVFLDGIKLFTKTSTGSIGNIGNIINTINSNFTSSLSGSQYNLGNDCINNNYYYQDGVMICSTKSQFSGDLNNLTIYDGSITDKQLNYYFIQEGYNVSNNLYGTIKSFFNNLITLQVYGIQESDKKENANYEYSFDNINFNKVSSGSIITKTNSSGALIYEYFIDVNSQNDGVGILYLRINKLGVTKFIGKITFIKETNYDIVLNEPNKSDETSKTISASFSKGNLTMSLTRLGVCNNSLVFEKYADLTFNSTKDNGVRICYKGVDLTTNKEFYRLSNPIEGIISNVSYLGSDIFEYYSSWKYSSNIKNNDSTFMMLTLLANGVTSNSSTSWSSLVDINGDGLVDLLYIGQLYGFNSNSVWGTLGTKRSIMINNGDYTFTTVYKCVNSTDGASKGYYGDCAGNVDLGN